MTQLVLKEIDSRGVATLTLNRPNIHNAFDDALITQLRGFLSELEGSDDVRLVVLTGAGKSFSAGADLNWMRSMAQYDESENVADALRLAELLSALKNLNKPTLARVNGAVFGGGVGLVACCDIAIAAPTAKFALTEVRLGLAPAVISPYVIAAIGERQASRYFLTGEAMDAETAQHIGLIHEVADDLDERCGRTIGRLLKGGPEALNACKKLVAHVAGDHNELQRTTAALIARLRVSNEGQEGLGAFLDKRPPSWTE